MLLKMNLQTCAAKILEGNEKNPSDDLAQAACEGAEECDVGLHMMQKKTLNQKSPLGMMEALDIGKGVKSHQESMIEKFGDDKGSRARAPPPFQRGEWSSNACPVHYLAITSEKDCKSAAEKMNMKWMGTRETNKYRDENYWEPAACITRKEISQLQGFDPGAIKTGTYTGGSQTFTNTVHWDKGGAKNTNEAAFCKFQEFEVTSGPCKVDAGCVTSPNYPKHYGYHEACTIEAPRIALALDSFETESHYDKLTVNGDAYSGEKKPNDIVPVEAIHWTSDYSISRKGWKLCLAETKYMGCFAVDQLKIKRYIGSHTSSSFKTMYQKAEEDGVSYFGMSRHQSTLGGSWTVISINDVPPKWGHGGCGSRCDDDPLKDCGCANQAFRGHPNPLCNDHDVRIAVYQKIP